MLIKRFFLHNSLFGAYGASWIHLKLHKTSWDSILNIGLIELAAILENDCYGRQRKKSAVVKYLDLFRICLSANVPSLGLLSQMHNRLATLPN